MAVCVIQRDAERVDRLVFKARLERQTVSPGPDRAADIITSYRVYSALFQISDICRADALKLCTRTKIIIKRTPDRTDKAVKIELFVDDFINIKTYIRLFAVLSPLPKNARGELGFVRLASGQIPLRRCVRADRRPRNRETGFPLAERLRCRRRARIGSARPSQMCNGQIR